MVYSNIVFRGAIVFTGAVIGVALAGATVGCNLVGPPMAVLEKAFPNKIAAEYKGLDHHTVAVMVWAESGIRIDYPQMQMDIEGAVQDKIKTLQTTDNPPEFVGTTFPNSAESIFRTQEDHPELDAMTVTELASRLNVDRLIYVEVNDFSTKSEASDLLSRGTLSGNVEVVEIKDGKAKLAYHEDNIEVIFPKDSPKEGIPNGDDYKIYQGTLDVFSTEIVNRFYDHLPPDEPDEPSKL
jgi:hypothetical protein